MGWSISFVDSNSNNSKHLCIDLNLKGALELTSPYLFSV